MMWLLQCFLTEAFVNAESEEKITNEKELMIAIDWRTINENFCKREFWSLQKSDIETA